MHKGLILSVATMLFSLSIMAQNAETVDVSKERDGFFSQTFNEFRVEGNVKNGLKDGTWYDFSVKKDLLRRVIQYQKGLMNGVSIEIDENGTLLNKSEYVDGKLNGYSYVWAGAGRVAQKNCYKNGELDGEQTIYYDNGSIQEESFYRNGFRDGVTTWYNREGNKSMMITYKKGLFDGKQETYYPSGSVKATKMYKNNELDGQSIEYYESGDIKSEAVYKNGALSGKVKQYEDSHPNNFKKGITTEKKLEGKLPNSKTKIDSKITPNDAVKSKVEKAAKNK